MKHYHPEAINNKVRDGDCEFSKIEFLAQITNICLQAFKKNTIQESFRKTGLILFDPEIALQKLRDLSPSSGKPDLLPTPLIPSQVIGETFFTTPTTICAFILYTFALTNPDYSLSAWKMIQEKYVKGILAKVNFEELVEDKLKRV